MPVIDASVWVALFCSKDTFHAQAVRTMDKILSDGQKIRLPFLVLAELAGAISRRTQSGPDGSRAVQYLKKFNPEFHAIDETLAEKAAFWAAQLHLRGADACYVAIAEQFGELLITFDRNQAELARVVIETMVP